ncbi:uncharacterized protein C8R40DRAFT_1092138 [Lentinula edodes]|uniref:uncharacterized protein n=1 Tax=Lentinula edodes TaxID=5353 RepID=UPI001E8E95F6|nr:uncharacterized protein C8R40DRAFT_1092138 [Lentinula edodes]KAH7878365.1 hypothetical protein C8R40DRAFT_1092138 [Lentinula edodes]
MSPHFLQRYFDYVFVRSFVLSFIYSLLLPPSSLLPFSTHNNIQFPPPSAASPDDPPIPGLSSGLGLAYGYPFELTILLPGTEVSKSVNLRRQMSRLVQDKVG